MEKNDFLVSCLL